MQAEREGEYYRIGGKSQVDLQGLRSRLYPGKEGKPCFPHSAWALKTIVPPCRDHDLVLPPSSPSAWQSLSNTQQGR